MATPPRSVVSIIDFPGMALELDARDLPPGVAEEQVNIDSNVAGQLSVRLGCRQVTFES